MSHKIRNIFRGLKNLWDYLPLIWRDRDWDHAYLLAMMEFKFRRMSKALGAGHTLLGPRHAKQLLVCAELCKRLEEDNYLKMARTKPIKMMTSKEHKYWARHVIMLQKQDQEYLGKLLGKYLIHWWD